MEAHCRRRLFWANVRRQVSLAGGEGGSQKMGVKALGMLCCQHPLCLNAESRQPPLESGDGQRLAERPCSPYFLRGPISRGIRLSSGWQHRILVVEHLQSLDDNPLLSLLWQKSILPKISCPRSPALRLQAVVERSLLLLESHGLLCDENRGARVACAISR